jgi:cytidylate kinase
VFRIISLEREYGCGGGAIAKRLAARLGWKLWDQLLGQEIAKMAQVDCALVDSCDEKLDGRLYRLTKLFFRGSHERGAPLADSQLFDADCMVSMMKRLALKIAEEGNSIIVGRGAPYFLRHRNDTFSVFLYAPHLEKVRRILADGRSEKEAKQLIDTVDRERMAFVKHYFRADWPTRALYHLMVNTGIGDDQVVATIVDTMHRLERIPSRNEAHARL